MIFPPQRESTPGMIQIYSSWRYYLIDMNQSLHHDLHSIKDTGEHAREVS